MFDIGVSGLAIIFLAPLMALIGVLIFVIDGGPVLFAQSRIGKCARVFRCLKFRTMVVDAEAQLADLLTRDAQIREMWVAEQKLKDDPRITPLGHFLRRSSLDELPQLFNVFMGDMSLVGPRPIIIEEVQRYGKYFDDYCRVRPGITGLWQVSGRNDVTYRRRVALDVSYVRSRSLLSNVRILLLTVPNVIFAKGSY